MPFKSRFRRRPATTSIVIVAYDMAREIPRTLETLTTGYQQHAEQFNYEVIVVDNGSPQPLDEGMVRAFGDNFSLLRIDNASPSPAAAVNQGVALSHGDRVGILIDGARMLSPGVLHWADQAFKLFPQPVVATLGFHLGPEHQREAVQQGYSREVEDELLRRIDWPAQGHRLFEIACLSGSSRYGWHAPLAESNCLFLSRALFDALDGFEERFTSPGGGLVNLDFYKRACESQGSQLVYLLGEGCFHQLHGGTTTGGAGAEQRRYHHLQAEYEGIRGTPHRVPQNQPVLLGQARPEANWHVATGTTALAANNKLEQPRASHWQAVGLEHYLTGASP